MGYGGTILIPRSPHGEKKLPTMGKSKVKLSLCFNQAPHYEGVLGKWRHSSTHSLTSVLDGGEWSASHAGWRKSPSYPLDRRLGGPQRRFGRGGLEKNSQPPSGIEP
jgi:hypothetical protein